MASGIAQQRPGAFFLLPDEGIVGVAGGTLQPFVREAYAATVVLLSYALTNIGQQGIFAGLPADAQIIAVRVGKPGALQAFARTSFKVVDGRKISVGWHFIDEEG